MRTAGASDWRLSLKGLVFNLSLVLVGISLVDLFINRLLFRAGPDVIAQLNVPTGLAVVGGISSTVEQLILFMVIASAAALFYQERERAYRLLSSGMLLIALCSGLLYGSLPASLSFWVSLALIITAGATIFGLLYLRISTTEAKNITEKRILQGFLVMVAVSFFLPLYFRAYSLSGPLGSAWLPLGFQSYELGIFLVMATSVVALVYAMLVPSDGFTLRPLSFAKAAILPTLIVAPILYGLLSSFFATQIFSLVIVTTTDFALAHDQVQALVVVWWFLLTAVVLLFVKARRSTNKTLVQEGIGLLLIMSTTFLLNYPYYLMLGVVGVLFLSHPLAHAESTRDDTTALERTHSPSEVRP
ncbi:MAG TPA: hypothetical protein VFV92_03045 [Candidatus Bathyarchaeia archaeon]|nr:hypothetical protein [Candidatus Bathyarchaeia archaeon]